jgi:hypothetical protein
MADTLPISAPDRANFETLLSAAGAGRLCALSATRKADGAPVVLVCAVNHDEDGMFSFVPLAQMVEGNPFEDFEPPTP